MINNINESRVRLRRISSKPGEIITWEVLTLDKKRRLGIIRQMNDQYLTKRIGWQEFKIKYWLGSAFYPQGIVIALTRKDIITKLLEIK